MPPQLVRSLGGEVFGTFALVFAGCGAIMVASTTHALGHLGVALSFGLVIMVMIYALGHVSGAHFNPGVTLGFALSRHFPWPRVFLYWGAQAIGAIGAALTVSLRRGGLLMAVLVLPLTIPVLIFGVAAASAANGGAAPFLTPFLMLCALSLFAIAAAPFAAAAPLRYVRE